MGKGVFDWFNLQLNNMFSTLNWRLSLIVNLLSIYYYRYFRTLKAWYGLWEMNIFLLKAEP